MLISKTKLVYANIIITVQLIYDLSVFEYANVGITLEAMTCEQWHCTCKCIVSVRGRPNTPPPPHDVYQFATKALEVVCLTGTHECYYHWLRCAPSTVYCSPDTKHKNSTAARDSSWEVFLFLFHAMHLISTRVYLPGVCLSINWYLCTSQCDTVNNLHAFFFVWPAWQCTIACHNGAIVFVYLFGRNPHPAATCSIGVIISCPRGFHVQISRNSAQRDVSHLTAFDFISIGERVYAWTCIIHMHARTHERTTLFSMYG